ncbi:MAG TPA: hypothetical protein VHG32_14270 [Thermoanaerobaculia bacterium]|jgi:hypothetical protein|nr:hypothetical protein [Thermoanaerobaculia bacterium]
MSKRAVSFYSVLVLSLLLLALPASAAAQSTTSQITCRMNFNLRGWSLAVKSATGEGTISCDNGQTAEVRIRAKGAGLSAGKYEIRDGHGRFSAVSDIRELFGSYAAGDVAAGFVKEGEAMAMSKGSVNLALAGKGTGFDLGAAVERFTLTPVK